MGPKDVTGPEAIRRAMREHDALGRDAFLAKYGFGKATKFVVVDGGREYDSKALLAAAHGFEHPDEGPLPNNFSGGDQTTSRLRALGFTVAAPSVSASPVRFGLEDCQLFERYAIPVHWNDQSVSAGSGAVQEHQGPPVRNWRPGSRLTRLRTSRFSPLPACTRPTGVRSETSGAASTPRRSPTTPTRCRFS